VDTGFRIKIMLDQWRVFQEQFHEGAILQSSMPRFIFVARLSADEDDEQIETWMIRFRQRAERQLITAQRFRTRPGT
jgi:hypothetical protein